MELILSCGGATLMIALYLYGTRHLRPRRRWYWRATAAWCAGTVAVLTATVGPLAEAGDDSFPAHMATHLLLGMVAPLLLVAADPVALLQRTLPLGATRRLNRFLRGVLVRWCTDSLVTAAIGAVSLWALYRTALLRIATEQPVVHLLVHAHVLVTGCLFTYSIVGSTARRASFARRAAALTMAIAVHSTMAKDLYAHPPHGVPAGQAQAGALVMYYGGDIIEALLMVALFVRWYRATAPRRPAATQAETACSPTVGP